MSLVAASRTLARRAGRLRFEEPTAYVYNPLVYARSSHELYLERFGGLGADVLLLGMNPGPFGMAQTGVPFGEVASVREWMGIDAPVAKPRREHPKRPVDGFACRRAEVSGARLWGWARERFVTPERFFSSFFVSNYCPLVFMEESGRNRTPDKLPADERAALYSVCDEGLREVVRVLAPRRVLGVGVFAQKRAREALDGVDVEIDVILHPSPASPIANRGWAPQVERQLAALGIVVPGTESGRRAKGEPS